jgi:hypothetical protein
MDDVLPAPVRSRPFGPLPRAAVAVYGCLLAAAGLTLYLQAGRADGYSATGLGCLLLGLGCVLLAARVGRAPRAVAVVVETPAVPEVVDTWSAAKRVVTQLADLEQQLTELTQQCAASDFGWPETPANVSESGRYSDRSR